MNTYELCEQLSNELTEDDILIVGSSCMAVRIFGRHYHGKAKMEQSDDKQGGMGATLPVSIAFALAYPDKRIVVVDGEGSFMQNIQELEVVNRLDLPINFIVIDNGGYASIRNSENRWFGRTSDGATFPDIENLAYAFGVDIHIVIVPLDEVPPPREA